MYILDSLAWANYRLGNKTLAIKQLQQAFTTKPEAEIGAHLGEALWSTGDKVGADNAWRKAESLDANNKTLKETLSRLWPDRTPTNIMKEKIWDGRFSVKVQGKDTNNGGSGSFTLTSESQIDILDIRNPIGGAMAKITITPSGAKLEDGDKVFEAHDADSLVQGYLGLPLPARGLSKWLSGEARTGAPASIERDEQFRTSKMIQDGWLMAFKWTSKNQLEKMDLKRNSSSGAIEIKLIFEPIDD
jgi:outer membrane biogenesis lipoprotein LolB